MTSVPSVSFSPPGLAMSYKKYNFLGEKLPKSTYLNKRRPSVQSADSITGEDLHHESFAVVSEYDWYV